MLNIQISARTPIVHSGLLIKILNSLDSMLNLCSFNLIVGVEPNVDWLEIAITAHCIIAARMKNNDLIRKD